LLSSTADRGCLTPMRRLYRANVTPGGTLSRTKKIHGVRLSWSHHKNISESGLWLVEKRIVHF
jgi:hypothetical protein